MPLENPASLHTHSPALRGSAAPPALPSTLTLAAGVSSRGGSPPGSSHSLPVTASLGDLEHDSSLHQNSRADLAIQGTHAARLGGFLGLQMRGRGPGPWGTPDRTRREGRGGEQPQGYRGWIILELQI